jgi:hypothetical protein
MAVRQRKNPLQLCSEFQNNIYSDAKISVQIHLNDTDYNGFLTLFEQSGLPDRPKGWYNVHRP